MENQNQQLESRTEGEPGPISDPPTNAALEDGSPQSYSEAVAELDGVLADAGLQASQAVEDRFGTVHKLQPKASESPPEAAGPEGGETQGDDGESQEKPVEIDYGAIPQQPILGEDQEPLTIGQMKDELTTLRTTRAKNESLEFSLMQQREIVNAVLANKGPLTEDQIQQVETMRTQMQRQQMGTVLEMFPEWNDPHVFEKVKPELQRVARQAGYSNSEIAALTHPAIYTLLEKVRRYEAREAKGRAAMEAARKPKADKGKSPGAKVQANTKGAQLNSILSQEYKTPEDRPYDAIDRILDI